MFWKIIFKISVAIFIFCFAVCLYAKKDRSPINAFNQAQKYYDEGNYQPAIEKLKSILDKKIKKDLKKRTYLLLGSAYLKSDKFDKSLSTYQLAVELFPKDSRLSIALGSLYYRFDLLGKAKELIEKALEISPEDYEANKYMAYTYEKLGFLSEAGERYEKALKNSTEIKENLWNRYAICLHKQRKLEKALNTIEIALGYSPDNSDFLITLARIHYDTGNFETALKTMKQAFALSPQNKEASLTLALWMIDAGNTKDSLRLAKHILEKEPNEPLALWICALAYYKEKNISEASRYLNLTEKSNAPFLQAVSAKMKEISKPGK